MMRMILQKVQVGVIVMKKTVDQQQPVTMRVPMNQMMVGRFLGVLATWFGEVGAEHVYKV